MEIITSRQNPRFKEIKKLIEDKKYRDEMDSFFVDGVNLVAQALANEWDLVILVYVPTEIESDYKKKIISLVPTEKHFLVSGDLYESLSVKKDIQGVGAVFKKKVSKNNLLDGSGVVLENIANPGNLGSIARLCAAFDVPNLYVIKPAVEFFHPETIRASMGGLFHLNLVEFDSTDVIKRSVDQKKHFCLGTSIQDDTIKLSDWTTSEVVQNNVLIWFGSEAKGLTPEARGLCQTLVRIPMHERVDSLNIAECAAIVIYELLDRLPRK